MDAVNRADPKIYRQSTSSKKSPIGDWVHLDTLQKIADVGAILPIYRKIVGDTVQEMNQSEKDAVDQAIADAQAQADENAKDFELVFDKTLKAFALVVLDEINILRGKHSLANRTKSQLNTAVKNKYDTL